MLVLTAVLLSTWSAICSPVDHAVYISVMEFHNSELRLKLFTDDLQNAIRNHSDAYVAVSEESFCEKNRRHIESYFQKKIKLRINDQPISISYRSSRMEGDSYWITFSFQRIVDWKKFDLTANYFMELFPTQTNIVKIVGTKQRFCKISSSSSKCSFSF